VRAVASERRSRHQNRELALERLQARLADGLRARAPRVATTPSRSARERRLEEKRRHARRKRERRRPDAGGDA
jgi:ribosome-associated protein